MQPLGHPEDIKKDDAVGHEVIIFDDLALLSPVIGGNHPFPAEEQPLGKPVKCFALIRRRLNGRTEVGLVEVRKRQILPTFHSARLHCILGLTHRLKE